MTVLENVTQPSSPLTNVMKEHQDELLSMGLRIFLSTAMAGVCVGSVFGGCFLLDFTIFRWFRNSVLAISVTIVVYCCSTAIYAYI